ncbi:hypothetical protein SIN09_00850 [Streptomyces sp. F8]|uniref:hypothetical protein n=1 Tax=Streptomyces sp. F8 TaxID=1436085 RepID=UPI0029CE1EDD|nr:hypothetical protein [Streptomyces sp. F8]MDX6758029.1 hypothetical protein [Streptomyces sp. F8]
MTLRVVVPEESEALPFTVEPGGARVASKEIPERIHRILEGLLDGGAVLAPRGTDGTDDADRAERLAEAVHGKELLEHLRHGVPEGAPSVLDDAFAAPGLAQETPVTRGVWPAALGAAAAAVRAAGLTARHGESSYALVRPPGHHAGPGWYGGYCFLNNAVIAARTLQEEGASRVGILDVDYHLGNGTLACVQGDPTLPFASVHSGRPEDFPYAFEPGPGLFAVASDPGPEAYLALVRNAVSHLRGQDVEALVVSVGYDVLAGDPHGSWSLAPEAFGPVAALVAEQRLPTVFVQEGGYGLPSLRGAARALALEASR